MSDYIKREEAEKRLFETAEIANSAYIDQKPCQIMMIAQNVVHLIPAADVRPVVRGKWEPVVAANEDGSPYQAGIRCSECGHFDVWEFNFCPNCGADMREES